MSGYLLAGGLGWNGARYGIGCWSIRAIDFVSADKPELIRRASEEENTDWFWMVRGGASAFPGVVMSFTIALHPRAERIALTEYTFPIDMATTLVEIQQHIAPMLPIFVEVNILLTPADKDVFRETGHKHVVLLEKVVFVENEEELALGSALKQAGLPAQIAQECNEVVDYWNDKSIRQVHKPSATYDDLFALYRRTLRSEYRYAVNMYCPSAQPSTVILSSS
jgi:FAD/FMN-containing dehydrogenase